MLESHREPSSPRRVRPSSVSIAESRRTSSCSSSTGLLNHGQVVGLCPASARLVFAIFIFTQLMVMAAYYTRISPQDCKCEHSPNVNTDALNLTLSEYQLERRRRGPLRLFYNRVPKCGSETLIELARILSRVNSYSFIHSRIFFSYFISESEQLDFAIQFNNFETPLFYERHLHFEDFTKFKMAMPVYINIMRDPIDRLVSWYYFRRFQEGHIRNLPEEERNRTYDECVLGNYPECMQPKGDSVEEGYFKMIPYFCGQDDFCRQPTEMALEKAISNVNKYFAIIGISEQYDEFIEALEYEFPDYFRGIRHLYTALGASVRNKYVTTRKTAPSDAVRRIMADKLQLEYEFYFFVKRRFEQYYDGIKTNTTPRESTSFET